MDNLTHSLIGAAFAEAAFQVVKRRKKETDHQDSLRHEAVRRAPLYTASIIAHNFPDLDLLFQIFEPGRLAYMVHHRGYTHSFFFAIPQAILVMLSFLFFERWRKWKWPREKWWAINGLIGLGLIAHVAMDFLNSYGVHPFSPVDNRWFYADSLYIIEPWLWVALVPLAIIYLSRKSMKIILAAIPLLGLAGGARAGVVPPMLAFSIAVTGFAFYGFLRRQSEWTRVWSSLLAILLVLVMFSAFQMSTRRQLTGAFLNKDGFSINDIAISAVPGNPLCWSFLTVETNSRDYKVTAGTFAHFGVKCPSWIMPGGVPLQAVTEPSFSADPRIIEEAGYQTPLAELLGELGANCRVFSWFQFARVPYREGSHYNDLRYAVKRKDTFSTFDSAELPADDCLKYLAPWTPPRIDLMEIFSKAKTP